MGQAHCGILCCSLNNKLDAYMHTQAKSLKGNREKGRVAKGGYIYRRIHLHNTICVSSKIHVYIKPYLLFINA